MTLGDGLAYMGFWLGCGIAVAGLFIGAGIETKKNDD